MIAYKNIFFIISIFFFLIISRSSEAALDVIPTVIDTNGLQGSLKQILIKVTNSGKEDINCNIISKKYFMTKEGLSLGVDEPAARSASEWISYTPSKFLLTPNATQNVTCYIKIPRSISGGYYAIGEIYGEPVRNNSSAKNGASIQFSFQSNIVILVSVAGYKTKAQPTIMNIDLIHGNTDISKGPVNRSWQIQALIENTGDIHTKIDVDAAIQDLLGSRIWSGKLTSGKGTLIPGFPRYFRSSVIASINNGNYLVGITVHAYGTHIGARGAQTFTVSSGVAKPMSNEGLVSAATGSIGISPGEVTFTGPVHARRFSSLTLKNQTNIPVSCQLKLGGWNISENGEIRPCDPTEATRSASEWIGMNPDKLDLAPGASGKIKISATIPEQGAEGEYYAALLVETTTQDNSKIAPSLVMVTVIPEKTSKPVVSSSGLVITLSSTAGYKFSVKARNDGNIRITPTVDFIVQDSTGKKVGDVVTATNPGEQLFPGVSKTIEAESARALANGKYTLVAEVSAGKDAKAQSLTIPFAIPLAITKTITDKKIVSLGSGSKPTAKPKPPVKKPTKSR